jgi:mannitol/fructose-specific phosphotransferase system IIA component (Ntr-type)
MDFDALDGDVSQIFVLTLTPKESNAVHMQFMAMISRMLNESGRKAVLAVKTRDELWDVMTQQG